MGGFSNNTVLPTWKWGLIESMSKNKLLPLFKQTNMVTFPQSHCKHICYLRVMDFNDLRLLHNPTSIQAVQKMEIRLNVLSIPEGKTFSQRWHISMAHRCHKSHRTIRKTVLTKKWPQCTP